MSAVSLSQRTEFPHYGYNSEHTVDVLITLRAEKREQDLNRAALCLSTTIDKSGSMSQTLPLVKRTMFFLHTQLSGDDKLGIVTYDTQVEEAMPLLSMDTEGKSKAESVVHRIAAGSATNLSGGLLMSIQQLKDAFTDDGNPGPTNAVMLLTDGLANQGITDRNLLKETVANTLKDGPPIKIHTFGYGTHHDEDLLKDIAVAGGGNYYFMQSDDDVPSSFADALGGLISVVAQNAILEISPSSPSVKIERIFTGLKTEVKPGGSQKLSATDLYSEERKDVLVRLKVPAVEEPIDAEALLNVHFTYFDIPAARTVTTESIVCIKRPADPPGDQVADEEIVQQRLRVGYIEVLEQARVFADRGDYSGAQRYLRLEMPSLMAMAPRSAAARSMAEEFDSTVALFNSQKAWVEGGRKKTRASVSAWEAQRAVPMFRSTLQASLGAQARASVIPSEEKADSSPSQSWKRVFSWKSKLAEKKEEK